jgi:hypothetical protein
LEQVELLEQFILYVHIEKKNGFRNPFSVCPVSQQHQGGDGCCRDTTTG